MNPKHPSGPSMTLGNMRELGLHRLIGVPESPLILKRVSASGFPLIRRVDFPTSLPMALLSAASSRSIMGRSPNRG